MDVSTITSVVVALAAIASTLILWKTFKSVNAQTEVSRKQFELSLRNREEMSRPELIVRVGKYVPAPGQNNTVNGTLTVTVRNCGAIPLRKLTVTVLSGNTATPLLYSHGTLSIPPGASDEVRGAYFLPAPFIPAETKCDFETPDGKRFIQWDKWTLYYSLESEHDHLHSQLEEMKS